MSRRLAAFCASILLLGALGTGAWWLAAPSAQPDDDLADLPVPPFPPRITDGGTYESCLATLSRDPVSAVAVAEAWQADGGGEGAWHCRGLALIASGKPAVGADLLEQLARQSSAPALARASVLGQAAQARLMVAQASQAASDVTAALVLSPDDTELLIMRASADALMERFEDAVADLTAALQRDPERADALLARAIMQRRMNRLNLAQADVSQALTLDPDYADALLERGILRQRTGDADGARADWEHARGLDPNSTTADLAQQNLSLLEVGPQQR